MDDQLLYGIGFDFEAARKEIQDNAAILNKQIEDSINATIKLNINTESLVSLKQTLRDFSESNPLNEGFSNSVVEYANSLNNLEQSIQKLSQTNDALKENTGSTSKELLQNIRNIAAAEKALADARKANENANKAAAQVETERAKALVLQAKEANEAAKAERALAKLAEKSQGFKKSIFEVTNYSKDYQEIVHLFTELDSQLSLVNDKIPTTVKYFEFLADAAASLPNSSIYIEGDAQGFEHAKNNSEALYTILNGLNTIQSQLNATEKESIEISTELNSVREQNSESLHQQAKSLEEITQSSRKSASDFTDVSKSAEEAFTALSAQGKKAAVDLAYFKKELEQTKNELELLDKAYKNGSVGESEYLFRKAELTSLQKDQTQSVNEYNKLLELNVTLLNSEVGSYKYLQAELKLTQAALKNLSSERNASVKDIEQLQSKSRALTEELERQRIAQGKYALTAGSFGQSVRDLTYAVRLLDPSLGILLQRTQRISVLNTAWNKANIALQKSLGLTAQAATKLMIGSIAALSVTISAIIIKIKEWYDEYKRMKEVVQQVSNSVNSSIADLNNYVRVLSSIQEGTEGWRYTLNKFNNEYGTHLNQLGIAVNSTQDLIDNYDKIATKLIEISRIEGFQKATKDATDKLIEEVGGYEDTVFYYFESTFGKESGTVLAKQFWTAYLKNAEQAVKDFSKFIDQIQDTSDIGLQGAEVNKGNPIYKIVKKTKSEVDSYNKTIDKATESFERWNTKTKETITLIGEQQKKLKELEALPLTTEEEQKAYNQKKDAIEKEIKRLRELGVQTKKQRKDAVSLAKEELSLIEEAYDRYKDLSKVIPKKDAENFVRETYQDLIPKDAFAFNLNDLRNQYAKFIKKLESLKATKAEVLKLKVELENKSLDKVKEELKKELAYLEKEINDQKIANTFYEKLLGFGVGTDVATRLTLDITGRQIQSVRDQIVDSLQTSLTDVGIDIDISAQYNINDLRDMLKEIPEEQKNILDKLISQLQEYDMSSIESLYKSLSSVTDFETKKSQIVLKGENERSKIRETALRDEEKKSLRLASLKNEQKEISKLQYETFKESDLYTSLFENLERVSTSTLNVLKKKLEDLKKSFGENLDPTQLKDISKRIQDVNDQIIERDPFKYLSANIGNYISLQKELRTLEKQSLDSLTRYSEQSDVVTGLEKEYDVRVKTFEAVSANVNATEEEKQLEQAIVNEIEERLIKERELLNILETQYNVIRKQTDAAKQNTTQIANSASEAAKKVGEWTNAAKEGTDSIRELSNLFGGLSEDTEGILNDIDGIIGGVDDISEGVAGILSGNPAAMVAGAFKSISGISKIASNAYELFSGKVKKANKEIERQEKLIKNVQYELSRLQTIASDLLGGDITKNLNQQAQKTIDLIQATNKKIDAENSKGKKKNSSAIAGWRDEIKELTADLSNIGGSIASDYFKESIDEYDKLISQTKQRIEQLSKYDGAYYKHIIKQLEGKVEEYEAAKEVIQELLDNIKYSTAESLLGTTISSAATSFANSWLDAYLSFENTKDAISDSYKDLIKQLIVNTLLAKAIEHIFDDIFSEVEDLIDAEGVLNENKLNDLLAKAETRIDRLDEILAAIGEKLNLRELLGSELETNLSGLSKSLSTISEDTALTLGAYLGSIEYYVVGQYHSMNKIIEYIESGALSNSMPTELIDIQNSALSELVSIRINTELTYYYSMEIFELFSSIRSVRGVPSTFGITISNN